MRRSRFFRQAKKAYLLENSGMGWRIWDILQKSGARNHDHNICKPDQYDAWNATSGHFQRNMRSRNMSKTCQIAMLECKWELKRLPVQLEKWLLSLYHSSQSQHYVGSRYEGYVKFLISPSRRVFCCNICSVTLRMSDSKHEVSGVFVISSVFWSEKRVRWQVIANFEWHSLEFH